MQNMSAWMQAFGGFAIGMAAGFAVRRARLCTFGAIEDALMGGDSRRLRVFGLALGIAILGTQGLIVGGFFDPELTSYVPTALPLVAILIGGVMFGIGMALAGAGLCWLALGDARLRRAPRLLSAGVVLGLMVIAGWIVTTSWVDEFAGPPRPQSLTFVSTVGKALYAGLLGITNFADFGVGTVFGVIAGSWLAAWRAAEVRWEAFDDDHEMRRHLAGAVLMGMGGILAGGCTIGQGLTAGSMLALSAPLAIGGMVVGARLGIAILVDDSPRTMLQRRWTHLLGRSDPAE